MVDVVKAMKWTYVSTVADEGNYGERGIGKFEERAKAEGKIQLCRLINRLVGQFWEIMVLFLCHVIICRSSCL
jgi:hypothetical protein